VRARARSPAADAHVVRRQEADLLTGTFTASNWELMRHPWPLLAAVCLTSGLTACGSGESVGPTLHDLQGDWIVSWTEAGSGTTCTWAGVELIIRDSTALPPTRWAGGLGACTGVYETGELTFRETVLDSLMVADGRLRFAVGSYRFQGTVAGDRLSGTVSHELPVMVGDDWVQTSGQWQASRQQAP
jgi:hypothetical protein